MPEMKSCTWNTKNNFIWTDQAVMIVLINNLFFLVPKQQKLGACVCKD